MTTLLYTQNLQLIPATRTAIQTFISCAMATNFSANQYENAFAAKRLQNWETPASFKERPSQLEGYTKSIANNRGHLLDGISRSQKCPWGGFGGTWDTNQGMKTRKLRFGSLSHDGVAEILTVHSPKPELNGKEITENPVPSPVPEPVDEKDIGISKHIKSVRKVELQERETEKDTCVTPPVPRTAERKHETPVLDK